MSHIMVKLGGRADSFSAFEIGALHYFEEGWFEDNPYEPGFFEYDSFFEGWAAARDGKLSAKYPSLKARFEVAITPPNH